MQTTAREYLTQICSAQSTHERLQIYEKLAKCTDESLLDALRDAHAPLMMFIRDSLQVQFAVEEQFSGTLKRLVLEENLQLTDSSRAQLANQWSELTPTLKATVEDANNVQGAVRAIAIWRILVKLLAKNITSSNTFTNRVCEAIRSALRSKEEVLRREALAAWRVLIDVFASDPRWNAEGDGSTTVYRTEKVDLIMRALRYLASRGSLSDNVFDTWWHLYERLGEHLWQSFDSVGHELLRFCVGGTTSFIAKTTAQEELAERLAQTLTQSPELVSLRTEGMNAECLDRNWPRHAALVSKLGDCLKTFLSIDPRVMSKPARNACRDALQNHAMFIGQCIRFYSLHAPVNESSANKIHALWSQMAATLGAFLHGPCRVTQKRLFDIQVGAWMRETSHRCATALKLIRELNDNDHYEFSADAACTICEHITTACVVFKDRITASDVDELQEVFESLLSDDFWFDEDHASFRLRRLKEVVHMAEKLLTESCVNHRVLVRLWNKAAECLHTHMNLTSNINEGSDESDDFTTTIRTVLFPLQVVRMHPETPTDFTKLNFPIRDSRLRSSALKNLFEEMSHCSSVESSLFSQLTRDIRSQGLVEAAQKNSALCALLFEYASLIVEFLPITVPSSGGKPKSRRIGRQKDVDAIGELPESIRRSSAFIAKCTELTVSALRDSGTAGKKPRTPCQQLYALVKCIGTFFDRILAACYTDVGLHLTRTFAHPLAEMVAFTAAKGNAHILLSTDAEFQKMLRKFGAVLASATGVDKSEKLAATSVLLMIGLTHSNEKIKSATADIWRKSFEKAECLEYPENFRTSLENLRSKLKMIKFPDAKLPDGSTEKFFDETMATPSGSKQQLIPSIPNDTVAPKDETDAKLRSCDANTTAQTVENADTPTVVPTARRLRKPRLAPTPTEEIDSPADVTPGSEAGRGNSRKLHDIPSHWEDAPSPKRSRVENKEEDTSPVMEKPRSGGGLPNEAEKKVTAGPSNDATHEIPATAVVHELSKDEPDEDRFSTASGATFTTANGELPSSVKGALAGTNEKATKDDEDNEIDKLFPVKKAIEVARSIEDPGGRRRALLRAQKLLIDALALVTATLVRLQ